MVPSLELIPQLYVDVAGWKGLENEGRAVRDQRQGSGLALQTGFENGRLTGRLTGDLGAEDAGRRPRYIGCSLKLRGYVLNGSAASVTRSGNLTSRLELKR